MTHTDSPRSPYLSDGQDTSCTPECCTCPRGVRSHLADCPAGAGNVGTVELVTTVTA